MKHSCQIFIFENSYKLTNHLVKRWMEIAKNAIFSNDRFTAAIAGGKTPIEFYSKLSSLDNHYLWQNSHLFLTDERFVPLENRDSNFRMIMENLLIHIPIPSANTHPVKTNFVTVKEAAQHYHEHIREFFGKNSFPRFDLILLGIGEDGHTASLFQGINEIEDDTRLTTTVSSENIKHERIGLTLPVINSARHVFFLVTGKNKAGIVKKIIENQVIYPASRVAPVNGEVSFFIDNDASSEIKVGDFQHVGEGIVVYKQGTV